VAACDERVSGDAGKHVDDALGVRAVELERLAEMACWSVGVVECWVSDASLHYSTLSAWLLCHHEAQEGHEGFIHVIFLNFVLFANFAVKCL